MDLRGNVLWMVRKACGMAEQLREHICRLGYGGQGQYTLAHKRTHQSGCSAWGGSAAEVTCKLERIAVGGSAVEMPHLRWCEEQVHRIEESLEQRLKHAATGRRRLALVSKLCGGQLHRFEWCKDLLRACFGELAGLPVCPQVCAKLRSSPRSGAHDPKGAANLRRPTSNAHRMSARRSGRSLVPNLHDGNNCEGYTLPVLLSWLDQVGSARHCIGVPIPRLAYAQGLRPCWRCSRGRVLDEGVNKRPERIEYRDACVVTCVHTVRWCRVQHLPQRAACEGVSNTVAARWDGRTCTARSGTAWKASATQLLQGGIEECVMPGVARLGWMSCLRSGTLQEGDRLEE